MSKTDPWFNYGDRYRSGTFDVREVIRWVSTGQDYYLAYILTMRDGGTVQLTADEFYEFEKKHREARA